MYSISSAFGSDALFGSAAMRAEFLLSGLENDGLLLQMLGQRLARAPRAFGSGGLYFFEDLFDQRQRPLGLLLQVLQQFLHLGLLLRGKLLGFRTEELAFELGDLGLGLKQLLLAFPKHLGRLCGMLGSPLPQFFQGFHRLSAC